MIVKVFFKNENLKSGEDVCLVADGSAKTETKGGEDLFVFGRLRHPLLVVFLRQILESVTQKGGAFALLEHVFAGLQPPMLQTLFRRRSLTEITIFKN